MKSPSSPTAHATAVWLVLVSATILSWWLIEHHSVPARVATTAVILIAALKVRLVFLHFMELRTAPLAWRALFEAWALLCAGIILAGYWFTQA
jgi:heme/copper-type cytochrome/quinol oxidase subunit 4